MSPLRLLSCLFVLFALASCSLFKNKLPEPVFRSAVKELPAGGTTVMVWTIEHHSDYVGQEDKKAEQEAIQWLQEHGLIVVSRIQIEKVLEDLESTDPGSVLVVGKRTGAQQVILLQAYSDRVMVRGVNTETGVMAWSGTGESRASLEETNDWERAHGRTSLIRKTLDAIWKTKR